MDQGPHDDLQPYEKMTTIPPHGSVTTHSTRVCLACFHLSHLASSLHTGVRCFKNFRAIPSLVPYINLVITLKSRLEGKDYCPIVKTKQLRPRKCISYHAKPNIFLTIAI